MYRMGDLVISTQGRDKNRLFMVLETVDENYVLIANGSLRKTEKPKKKKIKHLEYSGKATSEILLKLSQNGIISNSELRKMLNSISDGGTKK